MSHGDPNYPGNLVEELLSATDKNRIDRDVRSSTIHKFLRNKHKLRFSVGDILIKKFTAYGGDVHTEKVSYASLANKKYKCVYIDACEVPYVKPFKVNGELGDAILNCTQIDLDRMWFEQDPEQVDHIVLSDDQSTFNPNDHYRNDKERRDNIKAFNRKNRVRVNNPQNIRLPFLSLKKGDKFWIARDRETCNRISEYTVENVRLMNLASLRASNMIGTYQMGLAENYVTNFKTSDVLVVEARDENIVDVIFVEEDLRNKYVYLTKPKGTLDV